jgi:FkbM family methyltransferase
MASRSKGVLRDALLVVFVVAVVRFLPARDINHLNNFLFKHEINDDNKSHAINPRRRDVLDRHSFDMESFLSTFQAANPNYTDRCIAYLRSPPEYNRPRTSKINWKWHFSQYNQDWFMFVNFFHQYATTGKKGFYVDSGTNDWLRVSNTAWYDLCLGWDGICIEPSGMYHAKIKAHRSCHLVTNCLSNINNESTNIHREKPGSKNAKGKSVECVRLDSILDQFNVTNVDLWSLDVEGFEFKALAGVDFTKYNIQGLLLEQQDLAATCAQFPIDYRLTTLGYAKSRLVSDGFYWKSTTPSQYPNLTAMDEWFRELENGRCLKKQELAVKFFTD